MANLQERRNKDGLLISYSIRVYRGRDAITGKQLTPYNKTWLVPAGWTEKRAEKEARRQADLFEQQCRRGRAPGQTPTFTEYAAYVLETRERAGYNKPSTLYTYRRMLADIHDTLGRLRLDEIGPQQLNQLYRHLTEQADGRREMTAVCRVDFAALLAEQGLCPHSLFARAAADGQPVSMRCLTALGAGRPVRQGAAERVALALGRRAEELFTFSPVAGGSPLRYHRLISTILEQAVKESLLPDNPCRRAMAPRQQASQPNFFAPQTVGQILRALEGEPLVWKTMLHLFLVTGCRRGEILGLKWDKIDWSARRVRIDTAIYYTPGRGLYEGTPKTAGSIRAITLPGETMALLEQHREQQRQERGGAWTEGGYLFPRQDGTAMNPSQVNDWMARFASRHGLPHINPHAFRHTQASILCYCGVDVVSISHRLGHASTSTTANLYSHVLPQAEDRITQCISDVMIRPNLKGRKARRQGG